jgi:hypothetical protein
MERRQRLQIAAATGADPRTVLRWCQGKEISPVHRFAFEACCGMDKALDPSIELPDWYRYHSTASDQDFVEHDSREGARG